MTTRRDAEPHPALRALLRAAAAVAPAPGAALLHRVDGRWQVVATSGTTGLSARDLGAAGDAAEAAGRAGGVVLVAAPVCAGDEEPRVLLALGEADPAATLPPVEGAGRQAVEAVAAAVGHLLLDLPPGVGLRRTPRGWLVVGADEPADDLVEAMALADLLAGDEEARLRPARPEATTETQRLQVALGQLQHALHARVVVEQAIGVLAERHGVTPRTAFERLRTASRSRGRRVRELAGTVVASTSGGRDGLPPDLR